MSVIPITFQSPRTAPDGVTRVNASTEAPHLAGFLIEQIAVQDTRPVLRGIGAAAVNQAIKGCAIAREILLQDYDIALAVVPTFENVRGRSGETMSAVVLTTMAARG